MRENVNKMIELMDEMMNEVLKDCVDINMLVNADDDDYEYMKYARMGFKAYKLSKDLLIEQASMLDEMNEKLDMLLLK